MAEVRELQTGLSPCPNDTFALWGALHGQVAAPFSLRAAAIADIERLNRRAFGDGPPLDVTKLSLPAVAALGGRYAVLPAGAALGFGCGPLVVRRGGADGPATLAGLRGRRIAVPGRHTTAALLLGLFGPRDCAPVPMRFDRIAPAVESGGCDAGVIIHEGRFTYERHGLLPLADLGELWERSTGLPLPLGVFALRRDLGAGAYEAAGALLRASVELARADPQAPRAFVRAHAQELDDAVCDRHIALYVNGFTVDLGEQGRTAIETLLARGRAAGLLPEGPGPWWAPRGAAAGDGRPS